MNEDKATRYQRHRRVSSIASLVWTVVVAVVFVVSGSSVAVRNLVDRLVPVDPAWLHVNLVVAAYVAVLTLLIEVLTLPFHYYGSLVIERRYGLLRQSAAAWALDQVKGVAAGVILGAPAACLLYFFIRRFPIVWWLPAGLVFSALFVGLANLGPVLLLPLFYRIRPLARESLRVRLMALADRAGARVLGVYEWGLGEKTRKANAALTGLAGTRRILVSDTMLDEYSDDEIEVVLAHELAHHVHGDIWKGLALESGLVLTGFFVAAAILRRLGPHVGLLGPGDVAGLPILLLAAGAVSLVALPAAHALSRAHERSADQFALRFTRNSEAFMSAMRRLGTQNLAEEEPSKIVEWLFHSHPPIRERIEMARRFESRRAPD